MKLESQVCSLDLSKRLKELGVKQESAFVWDAVNELNFIDGDLVGSLETSAFTVAELGEILPEQYFSFKCHTEVEGDGIWSCAGARMPEFEFYEGQWVTADTEANARAKMLIHLIEQGIVKP